MNLGQLAIRSAFASLVGLSTLVGATPVRALDLLHKSPVPCASVQTLRGLASELSMATNPATGNTISYLVLGDGARSNDLIVMFPGTSGILPDWPVQMITNSTYSPNIVGTRVYNPDEDGAISLCHDYRLVLFDYPGVGTSTLNGRLTADRLASDVNAMLDHVRDHYFIPTGRVNLVGWSLGTLYALKFAWLAPVANPLREIKDVILIASKPGGSLDGYTNGNQASCVTTVFDRLRKPVLDPLLKLRLRSTLVQLMFPYQNQLPYDKPSIDCTAAISGASVKLNVALDCPKGSLCRNALNELAKNRRTSPWSETDGVPTPLYRQQRHTVQGWNFCHCLKANEGFNSRTCFCALGKNAELFRRDGGVCRTNSKQANRPVSSRCDRLQITGNLTVINGQEDLFIQWTYGRELVRAYQRAYGTDKARIRTYTGIDGAGHGVLMQHPKWTQQETYGGLTASYMD